MNKEENNIKSELEQLGCRQLSALQGVNPYKKPEDAYFESNMDNIEEKGLLYPYSKEMVFDVPENYFTDLDINISELISLQSQDETHLYSFEKDRVNMPFAVPENYFEQLRPDFLETEEHIYKKKAKAKVVSFFQNVNKYVAAAVILVLFSVGANIMLRLKEEKKAFQMLNNMDINNELADVPTEEIFNYLNQSSSKNMEYLINPSGQNNPVHKMMSRYPKENNGTNVKDASDKEILEYLSDDDNGF